MDLEVVQLGKEVCQTEVEYNELEWIVEAFYPDFFPEDWQDPKWVSSNIVSENEWNNDTKQMLWLENDEGEVEAFLNDPDRWKAEFTGYGSNGVRPSYTAFLEDLRDLGIIDQTEFLVDISW